jgi:hypothetical protein
VRIDARQHVRKGTVIAASKFRLSSTPSNKFGENRSTAMNMLSNRTARHSKSFALCAAALLAGAVSLVSFEASAKPFFQPVNPAMQPIGGGSKYKPVNPSLQPIGGKFGGCGKGWAGCNPGTYTPGGGYGYGYGAVNVGYGVAGQSAIAADDDCYYVRRRVFVRHVGMVRKRVMVCD